MENKNTKQQCYSFLPFAVLLFPCFYTSRQGRRARKHATFHHPSYPPDCTLHTVSKQSLELVAPSSTLPPCLQVWLNYIQLTSRFASSPHTLQSFTQPLNVFSYPGNTIFTNSICVNLSSNMRCVSLSTLRLHTWRGRWGHYRIGYRTAKTHMYYPLPLSLSTPFSKQHSIVTTFEWRYAS